MVLALGLSYLGTSGAYFGVVALALMLLVGAGLLIRSFVNLASVDPGFRTSRVVSMQIVLPDTRYAGGAPKRQFYADLIADLKMEVFVAESATDSTLFSARAKIAEVPGVSDVEFISKDDAREQLTGWVGMDLLVGYDLFDPLPRS